MGIVTIVSVLLQVVMSSLQAAGVTTPSITALITGIETAILPLFTNLGKGTSNLSDVLASLAALSGVISTLKATTGISPALLAQLNTLDTAVEAAISAYLTSQKGYDPTLLAPIV